MTDSNNTAPQAGTGAQILHLASEDNIGVATGALPAGTVVTVGAYTITTATDIALGHKIALHAIATGAKILKYGAPIGSAAQPIAAGEHVHSHNLKSDYLDGAVHEHEDARS